MKKIFALALLLGLGMTIGCDNPTPPATGTGHHTSGGTTVTTSTSGASTTTSGGGH